MNNKTTNKKQLSEEEKAEEVKKLSEQSNQTNFRQLDLSASITLGDEDVDTGFDVKRLSDTADPDTSHRIYYTIRRLMVDNLPKGKENKKLRQYIYDEKSLFLNRGQEKDEWGIRGSDERMAYIENFLSTALDTVYNWIKAGANPFDLYQAFHDLNEERGYHQKN